MFVCSCCVRFLIRKIGFVISINFDGVKIEIVLWKPVSGVQKLSKSSVNLPLEGIRVDSGTF